MERGDGRPGAMRGSRRDHRLILAYYLLATGVLSLYGIRVCPFIAGLDPGTVLLTFAVAFAAAFALQRLIEPLWIRQAEPFALSVRQFALDLALFAATGVGVALFNHFVFGFPLESGAKVLVGGLLFGLFAGLDDGLARERSSGDHARRLTEDPGRIFPITDRLFVIFLCVGAFTAAVAGMVVVKDVDYLIEHLDQEPHAKLRRAVFLDIGFVVGTVLLLALRLLWSYGRNLAHVLRLQIDGLGRVEDGDLETYVPVITRDEFSLIAARTNRMIAALRDAVREQEELFTISRALATELGLDRLLERIVATTRSFVGAERVSLFLHDAARDELWGRITEGSTEPIRFPSAQGIAGACFHARRPIRIEDAYADPRFNPEFDRRLGFVTRSLLCVPVEDREGRCLGVIQALNKRSGPFDARDERRLQAFSAQAATALVNARLFTELARSQRYNQSILRSLSNGVVTLDPGNRLVTANQAARTLLGLGEAALGSDFPACLGPGNEGWLHAGGGQPEHYLGEIEIVRADGQVRQATLSRVTLTDPDERPIGSMLVFDDITEEKRVRHTLSRYLAPEVAEQMLAEGELLLGGTCQTATVLFSDIRDFTTLTERLGPRQTVSMLNEYFTQMVEAIAAENGILDKFIGDAVMALFGIPFGGTDDAERAVRAALAMHARLHALNTQRRARGEPPLAIGVGISTGEVVAGNVGSPRRMDYTVIGDTVNLSARLESATKDYGVAILLSEATVAALREAHPLRRIDRVRVKGKREAVDIHQLMLPAEQLPDPLLRRFDRALGRYLEGAFDAAVAEFAAILDRHPDDGPARRLHERCLHLARTPPRQWDGAWPPPG